MKNVAVHIAIATLAAKGALAAPLAACAPGEPAAAVAERDPRDLVYPGFCDIPQTPKNIRSSTAFKSAVVETRVAGAGLVRQTAPDTFSLSDTGSFAGDARRQAATPPPPMTSPSEADTEAFAAKARAKATPPPRPH